MHTLTLCVCACVCTYKHIYTYYLNTGVAIQGYMPSERVKNLEKSMWTVFIELCVTFKNANI